MSSRTDKYKNYYARINGKDYPIAYDFTITEEFSETLDSGSIRLPHVFGTIELKPYDDVILHDFQPTANGQSTLPSRPFGVSIDTNRYTSVDGEGHEIDVTDETSATPAFAGHFYRHMLVGSYTREQVFLPDVGGKCYNYSIELISETKGLETVQLPNKTISQPIGTVGGLLSEKDFQIKFTSNYAEEGGVSENWQMIIKTVNDYTEGFIGMEALVTTSALTVEYNDWFIFAGQSPYGEDFYVQNQFSSLSPMTSIVEFGEEVTLPDWHISGVGMVYGKGEGNGGDNNVVYELQEDQRMFFHPVKHWIIRDVSLGQDNFWDTRSGAITAIEEYLYWVHNQPWEPNNPRPEIINLEVAGVRDIQSTLPIADKKVTFHRPSQQATSHKYMIYLYVEDVPYTGTYKNSGGVDTAIGPINLVGMVEPSPASQPVTEQYTPLANTKFLLSLETPLIVYADAANVEFNTKSTITVYEAMRQAIQLYSPYVKITNDGDNWEYRRKYSISDDTRIKFQNVVVPENQWNYPNLRDYLTRIMYVADCIPVVKDNVITHMCLADRSWAPFDTSKGLISYESYSMDGGSYCDRTLRNYSDALSRDNVVQCVERLGFKNGDVPNMTLENMRLELSHPIYKINKVYMCYYNVYNFTENGVVVPKMKLIKQDITPLVLLNEQRNLLSEDWATYENASGNPKTLEQLAQFKYATIGYNIGDKNLSGWGLKYSHPQYLFWSSTRTTIENMFEFVRNLTPDGVDDGSVEEIAGFDPSQMTVFDSNALEEKQATVVDPNQVTPSYMNSIIDAFGGDLSQNQALRQYLTDYSQRLRTLTFLIDYQGYISSAVVTTKDFHDGNVVSRDNPSSSLSFVESDGINQKEKVNRLGNATSILVARYQNGNDIQPLPATWDDDDHTDLVMYRRQIVFGLSSYTVNYTFARDYTIRNYFTSVYAKHRPFALASYAESVERQENRNIQILFSDTKSYYQKDSKQMGIADGFIGDMLSFYTPSEYDANGNIIQKEGVDCAYYYVFPDKKLFIRGQCGAFATDVQKFTSGNSLCFTVGMKDNVSAGVYVSDYNKNLGSFVGETYKNSLMAALNTWDLKDNDVRTTTLLTGCKQDWFMFPVDEKTGFVYHMGFAVGERRYEEDKDHHNDIYAINSVEPYSAYDIYTAQLLPLMDSIFDRPNGEIIYFGTNVTIGNQTKAIGAGYPRISFREATGGAGSIFEDSPRYYADLTYANLPYSYGNWIVENPQEFASASWIHNQAAKYVVPYRDKITEVAYAKFNGKVHATDAEETDDCVFKDGKERIITTMQFEPVAEDKKIKIGEYMMKLSDIISSKDKTYEEKEFSSSVSIRQSALELKVIRDDTNVVYFNFPQMDISIPIGAQLTFPIAINKDFSWSHTYGSGSKTYVVRIKSIVGYLNNDEKQGIVCTCHVYTESGGSTVDIVPNNGNIVFPYTEFNSVVSGRASLSSLPAGKTFPKAYPSCMTYRFFEDELETISNPSSIATFNTTSSGYTYSAGLPNSSDYFSFYTSNPGFFNGLGKDNIIKVTAYRDNGSHYVTTLYDVSDSSNVTYGDPITIPPTMLWGIFDETMGDSTPFDTIPYDDLVNGSGVTFYNGNGGFDIDEYKFIPNKSISISKDDHGIYEMNIEMPAKKREGKFFKWIDDQDGFQIATGGEIRINTDYATEYLLGSGGTQHADGVMCQTGDNDWKFRTPSAGIANAYIFWQGNFEPQYAVGWLDVDDGSLGISNYFYLSGVYSGVDPLQGTPMTDISKFIAEATEEEYTTAYGTLPSEYMPSADYVSVSPRSSLRCYYLEDGLCHFVFGVNLDTYQNGQRGLNSDCLHAIDADNTMFKIHISVLDNRSYTVINDIANDPEQGDGCYKLYNYAGDNGSASAYNKCVKKE